MAKKHMKKCSPSLAIKKMKIKTTLRFHLTPVKIAIIKNTAKNRCWQGCEKKGTLVHTLLVGMQTSATTMEKKYEGFLKI
jgi:hypothetical protein